MGILSDFVVADASDADAIAANPDRRRWPAFQSKGFTPLEVAWLHFLITGQDAHAPATPRKVVTNPFTRQQQVVSALGSYSDFKCLLDAGESWVHIVPEALVRELANATQLAAVAERWAECEEMQGADPGVLNGVLVALQRLARVALAQGKPLLLWTSL
jgi:hypothetical protein